MATMSAGGEVLCEGTLRVYNKEVVRHAPKDVPQSAGQGLSWWVSLLTNVVRTLEEVRISNSHLAAAVDALSGLFKAGLDGSNEQWSNFCTDPSLWKNIMSIYFDRSSLAKCWKQLLDALINVLYFQKKNDLPQFTVCLEYVVPLCIRPLLDQSALASSRPSMQILSKMLGDGIITSRQITSLIAGQHTAQMTSQWQNENELFVYHILAWARNPDLARTVGKLLALFCTSEVQDAQESVSNLDHAIPNFWLGPLKALLKEYPETIDVLEKNILPNLLRVDAASSRHFQKELSLQSLWEGMMTSLSDTDIRLSLMFLRVNRDINVVDLQKGFPPDPSSSAGTTEEHVTFEEQILLNLLIHQESEIKVAALSLLTSHRQITQPINPVIIHALGDLIKEFFSEVDAKIRNDFLATIKRFFVRLETIAWRLDKMSVDLTQDCCPDSWTDLLVGSGDKSNARLLANVSFLETYSRLIGQELVPSGSFPRHILALKALSYLQALRLPFGIKQKLDRHVGEYMASLLTLLMDRFEDVRAGAAHVLISCKPDMVAVSLAMKNGERLMRASGRADHADGFGRLVEVYQIWTVKVEIENQRNPDQQISASEHDLSSLLAARLFNRALFSYAGEVEKLVAEAELDLKRAIADAPLHGKMIALRYLLEASKFSDGLWLPETTSDEQGCSVQAGGSKLFCERVASFCTRIWKLVHPILCDDSPEGLEFFAGEEDDLVDVGTKDTLSYSWRALKEASLLIQAVLKTMERTSAVASVDMKSLGDLLFAQLAQLRHRGAFSAVAQTFTFYCSFSTRHATITGDGILESFYARTLDCILEKGTALTRRSAGLPALIVGLLCANPGGPFMDKVMADLKDITQRPAESMNALGLPQVHALNCLKDIFPNTKLGSATEPQLSEVLVIAANCLDHEVWAIRNSGLMLLKALIVRLEEGRMQSSSALHVARRRISSKSTYGKHPALSAVVVGLLESAIKFGTSNDHENRETRLIEKTFPAIEIIERVGIPEAVESKVKGLVNSLLSSKVWALRNKAANCLSLVCDVQEVIRYVELAFERKTQNTINGGLLLIRHFIREVSNKVQIEKIREYFIENLRTLSPACRSHLNQQLLFETLLEVCKIENVPNKEFLHHCLTSMAQTTNLASSSSNEISEGNGAVEAEIKFWTLAQCIAGEGYAILPRLQPLGEDALHAGLQAFDFLFQAPTEFQAHEILTIALCWKDCANSELVQCLVSSVAKAFGSAVSWAIDMDRSAVVYELEKFCDAVILDAVNQETSNEVCRLYGTVAALSLDLNKTEETDRHLRKWCSLMRSGMRELLDVEVRQAVLESVENFKDAVSAGFLVGKDLSSFVGLLLVIYDGMIDDDKDIRLYAARLASWILPEVVSSAGKMSEVGIRGLPSLSPVAARSKILALVPRISRNPHELFEVCLERIAGCEITQLVSTPASTSFEMAMAKSTTLFDEERQNQYVDELQESKDWLEIINKTPALSDYDTSEIQALERWCQDSSIWYSQLENTQSVEGLYGPLGPASQLDAYLVLKRTQMICGWFSKSIQLTVRDEER